MFKKVLILILFILPLVYVGMILAVGVHEILGHGVGAELMGHTFTQFTLLPDGMGWANYDYTHDITNSEQLFILLAGPISTYIAALLFFILAFIFRKRIFATLTFLIFGFTQLMDGAPYMLWNSILPVDPGDFGRALQIIPVYRVLFICLGALMLILGIAFFNLFIYRIISKWLGNLERFGSKFIVVLIMFLSQTGAWFIFDWNQLAPGIGLWPAISSISITGLVLLFVLFKSTEYQEQIIIENKWLTPLALSWIVFGVILYLTIAHFQYGISLV